MKSAILLYADIEGYTAILNKSESEANAILKQFRAVLKDKAAEYTGEIIQLVRDRGLVTFAKIEDALACAKQAQMAWQASPKVPVRIALHHGPISVADDEPIGAGIAQAIELERLGTVGSIVLSEAIFDQLEAAQQTQTTFLKALDSKYLGDKIKVYALNTEGLSIPAVPEEIQEKEQNAIQSKWRQALQILLGYLVGTWTFLQFFDWMITRYKISPYWTDILLWTFIGVIPSVLLYFLYRERINQGIIHRREQIFFGINLLLVAVPLSYAYRGTDLGSVVKTVTFMDADGKKVTEEVIKNDFRQEILIFEFEQEQGPDSTKWISRALGSCIPGDMNQNKYLNVLRRGGTKDIREKVEGAQLFSTSDFFIDGTY
ncbi:MAG: adenylate/guanylate cyclase domain-containing protein, partial [Bacteroidota bacterium]